MKQPPPKGAWEQFVKTARSICLLTLVLLAGCSVPKPLTYYTPKPSTCRPPAVEIPKTAEAQACARTCLQTHEICRGNCRMAYTQHNGHEVEQQTQACHDQCDDARDGCLRTCT